MVENASTSRRQIDTGIPFPTRSRPTLPMLLVVAVILIVACFSTGHVVAQGDDSATALEYRMKAAYLLKFITYVTWPAESVAADQGAITVAVVGESPIIRQLAGIQGRKVNGRPILVEHFKNTAELGPCHILFIAASQKGQVPSILRSLRGRSVLTVGETSGFIEGGGMIHIFAEANRVRFEVAENTARSVGLAIDPTLLDLAH